MYRLRERIDTSKTPPVVVILESESIDEILGAASVWMNKHYGQGKWSISSKGYFHPLGKGWDIFPIHIQVVEDE